MHDEIMHRTLVCLLLFSACQLPPAQQQADGGDGDAGEQIDALIGNAHLRLSAIDDESNVPMPARAIIRAVHPTPPVEFNPHPLPDPVTGHLVEGSAVAPGVIGTPNGVLLMSGEGTFPIQPGKYRVLVTRGTEWEAVESEVTIAANTVERLEARLNRSVDTHGWLAADPHNHTSRSIDGHVIPEYRVVSLVTSGISIVVITDHNVITDPAPMVDLLGYGQIAKGFAGDEFNFLEGHGGAFPLPCSDTDPWGGVIDLGIDYTTIGRTTAETVFGIMRSLPTHPVVIVNHPRMPPDLGYFINLQQFGPNGWSPPAPLPTAGLFDGLELINGYMDNAEDVRAVMRDWFFLLSSGYRIAAMTGSDSHSLTQTLAGFPRTWLRLPTTVPANVTGGALANAIRAGRTVASNGPFARLTVNDGEIGDLVIASDGVAVVEASVDAPNWVPVEHVELYVNGARVLEQAVASGFRPLWHARWTQAIPLTDSWIVLVARGSAPLPADIAGENPGLVKVAWAITSPVYVDADGDGQWHPDVAQPDPGPLP